MCAGTSLEYLGQGRISRSSGQGQRHRSNKALIHMIAGGLPSTERQSYFVVKFYDTAFVYTLSDMGQLQ